MISRLQLPNMALLVRYRNVIFMYLEWLNTYTYHINFSGVLSFFAFQCVSVHV